ncbi:hypothetical protein PMAYCL1PPCAC_31251, partial [Pristionchus mayeri]
MDTDIGSGYNQSSDAMEILGNNTEEEPVNVAPTTSARISGIAENLSQGQPVIRFTSVNEDSWQRLYGENRMPVNLKAHVVADKSFNYSYKDGCFVNQNKNHFQVSASIEACDDYKPRFVFVNGAHKPIQKMQLAFCGIKLEMTSTFIEVKQSQNDRQPSLHKPVELSDIPPRQVTK